MNALTIHPVTGYQESGHSAHTFNSERKQEFIKLARQIIEDGHEYPNVGDLCRVIGISLRTFQNHVAMDERFGQDWRELELKGEATCLSDMYALRKKNPMYMFGWLRARFPEKYEPSRKEISPTDFTWIKTLIDKAKPSTNAVEAEIISTTSKDAANSSEELADNHLPSENMK